MTTPFLEATTRPAVDPTGLHALHTAMQEYDEEPLRSMDAANTFTPRFDATHVGEGPGVYGLDDGPGLTEAVRGTRAAFSVADKLREHQAEQAAKAEQAQQAQQAQQGEVQQQGYY